MIIHDRENATDVRDVAIIINYQLCSLLCNIEDDVPHMSRYPYYFVVTNVTLTLECGKPQLAKPLIKYLTIIKIN